MRNTDTNSSKFHHVIPASKQASANAKADSLSLSISGSTINLTPTPPLLLLSPTEQALRWLLGCCDCDAIPIFIGSERLLVVRLTDCGGKESAAVYDPRTTVKLDTKFYNLVVCCCWCCCSRRPASILNVLASGGGDWIGNLVKTQF